MMKWLVLAVVIVAVLWWLGRGRSGPRGSGHRQEGRGGAADRSAGEAASRNASQPPPAKPEPMLACAHCGVWLPRADALLEEASQRWYCSDEHRRAGPRSS